MTREAALYPIDEADTFQRMKTTAPDAYAAAMDNEEFGGYVAIALENAGGASWAS